MRISDWSSDVCSSDLPKRPVTRNRFHYNWHWNWDFGNGDIGNQGVHEIDIARWGLGVTLPVKISATGGHFMFEDDQQTPNDLMAVYEFANPEGRSEEHTSELQSLMRISYAVFCLKKKKKIV